MGRGHLSWPGGGGGEGLLATNWALYLELGNATTKMWQLKLLRNP